METIGEREKMQVERANATGLQPVVFVHGLWLLASSWDSWAKLFEDAGFVALTPGWPGDPVTVEEARAHPERLAGKSIGRIADYYEQIILSIKKTPVIVGHCFGGLLSEILAGRGLSAATVAISPAPFRGGLSLPISTLRSALPVLSNPANHDRAVALTYDQFRYAFANAVDEEEAKALYDRFSVPGGAAPVFQSALANLNPWTEAKVESNEDRGPLLIIVGSEDRTTPPPIAQASFEIEEKHNDDVTEYLEIAERGHSLTIDRGWQEVAEKALAFVQRFAPAELAAWIASGARTA